MSINRLMPLQGAVPPAAEPDDSEWLLQMLRKQITAVDQAEGDTLKKAGMIARLGALYLRASGAAELKRSHKELARRCAHLEEQLAALQSSARTESPPAAQPDELPEPTRGAAVPAQPGALPRVRVRTPLAPEPEAPRILVIGSPAR